VESYLYKDILELVEIRNSKQILDRLLQLLAFQIGNEVSFTSLANDLNINQETVQKYIELLEDAFIIFRLPAFSRNLRQEVFKTRKIYFYDLGVRNSLIKNFNPLSLRDDLGSLWENFMIIERLKQNKYKRVLANMYFWRNYAQAEIDYIEEKDGILNCFEFKWNDRKKAKLPNSFKEAYPDHTFKVINQENWLEILG
jgi:predicted AAA+ superfamily ATPase